MRVLILLVAASTAYGLAPFTGRLGAVLGSTALVVLGVVLALAASFAPGAIAAAGGALGAFGYGLVITHAPALAGAVLLALCFAERTLRVRGRNEKLVHIGVVLAAGGAAGFITAHYAAADITVRAVVVLVSAVLAALPLFIEADDPMAYALASLAEDVDEPAKSALCRGADLRRTVDASFLDKRSARDAKDTWKNLLRLAQARARLQRTVAKAKDGDQAVAVCRKLDQRICEHVEGLTAAYTAADAAKAATIGADDEALRTVKSASDTLDEVSKVMMNDVA